MNNINFKKEYFSSKNTNFQNLVKLFVNEMLACKACFKKDSENITIKKAHMLNEFANIIRTIDKYCCEDKKNRK